MDRRPVVAGFGFLDVRSIRNRSAPRKDLQLVEATDPGIFRAARAADAVVLTKDRDFVELVNRLGAPLRVIWLTCGNTSNRELMRILDATFCRASQLLASGEAVVEIKG